MLAKLQAKWKVNGWNLLLILTTFALGGSLCGFVGRKLLLLTGLEKGVAWVVAYIIVMTLIWPFCVLLVSIPLGQFAFFKRYITRIMNKMGGKTPVAPGKETRIAIFASGAGSNARNIIAYFKNKPETKVVLVVCNNPGAGVIKIAQEAGVPVLMITKDSINDPAGCLAALKQSNVHVLILAGFLWKIPPILVDAFPKRIINIHPALLPSYGGKGMYGHHVHEAVIAQKEKQTGITIHLADEKYDQGTILFQTSIPVTDTDTADSLAEKIHQLEQAHFPSVIEAYLQNPS